MSLYTQLASVEEELREAKEKLTKYSNIHSAVSGLPGYLDICMDNYNTSSAYVSKIITNYEPIDAGAMATIDNNFKKIEEDFAEMIAQGNRLIAKYQERIELLEKETERLLAEIAAAEAAATRARVSQTQTYTSQRSPVVKPKFNNKFVIQSTK